MRAVLARLLRSLTSTTLSAQLAGMLIGGILFLHGVATFTVQLVEERQAARSALLEQANSLALSLQLLHSEPFEYKRSLLERLERLDVVHLSLSDAPNPARQARDERALYLRDRLRKNLNSIETDLDTREMLTEVQRVHVADSMNPTLRRHVPWTHVYESRVSVRLDDGKWLCVVISSDAYDFSPSQASLTMLLLEAGLLILLILVVVHRVVRPLRVLSGKAESFGRNLYTAPLPEDGPTEVREAARAFNKMQERIRAGVGQHERILAAVAHDLRTPLTRIRLRVESMDPASPLRAKLLGDIDILGGIMANSDELTRGNIMTLLIHPEDAAARGLHDGDPVRAKNKRGHAHFTLKLSDRVNRGTLVTEGVWWQTYTKDGNTNRLTSMRLTDKDGGSTFYDVSIDIEKA